ncbi:MAG: cystathionine beta-lyase [Pseudomonadota bacterium]
MKDETRAVIGGRDPAAQSGAVNPPVYHVSTIVYDGVADYLERDNMREGDTVSYGIHGTPSTYALEQALSDLEAGPGGGHRTRLCNSGLQAQTMPMLCVLSAGDHLLIPDNVYGPVRGFAKGTLRRLGIEVEFYDPLIGGDIRRHFRPNTKLVHTESPGSWTFEVQDIPAIAAAAKEHGALTMMDNTWASPLYFKAFEHGVDISTQAVTKYVGGHSDMIMGSVTSTKDAYDRYVQRGWRQLGLCGSPDDCFLAARGLRTLPVRLRQHWTNGLAVAEWLMARPEVAEVIHPAMPHDPGYALWQRDFRGAASLFAFTLQERYSSLPAVCAMLDPMERFAIGSSWGAFESLIVPVFPAKLRTATRWPIEGRAQGQVIRIHVGLEAVEDLIADLDEGFARLRAAST